MIVFGMAGLIIAYYLGYLFGFKTGVKSIIEELNKITKDFLDKTKELKKEVDKTKKLENSCKKQNKTIQRNSKKKTIS